MDFATAGAATSSRLSLELFKQTANLDLTAVHYRGGNKAIIDLLGGQVKGMLISISVAIPYVKTGKLTAIGVSSTKRAPLLPATSARPTPSFRARAVSAHASC